MLHHRWNTRLFAASLAALAGYVDAIGFLSLGGFFVSFMSGNSTRLGIGLSVDAAHAALAAGLIATFVLGVTVGAIVGNAAGRARTERVLALVTLALLLSAVLYAKAQMHWHMFPVVFAMGASNVVYGTAMPVGLTYMTGTLVRLGQSFAVMNRPGERWAWWPYAMHWGALVGGAALGAVAYAMGRLALWPAALLAAVLAVVAWRARWRESRDVAAA